MRFCTETDTHVHTLPASIHYVLIATLISHHFNPSVFTYLHYKIMFFFIKTLSSLKESVYTPKNVINHKYVNTFVPKVLFCVCVLKFFLQVANENSCSFPPPPTVQGNYLKQKKKMIF